MKKWSQEYVNEPVSIVRTNNHASGNDEQATVDEYLGEIVHADISRFTSITMTLGNVSEVRCVAILYSLQHDLYIDILASMSSNDNDSLKRIRNSWKNLDLQAIMNGSLPFQVTRYKNYQDNCLFSAHWTMEYRAMTHLLVKRHVLTQENYPNLLRHLCVLHDDWKASNLMIQWVTLTIHHAWLFLTCIVGRYWSIPGSKWQDATGCYCIKGPIIWRATAIWSTCH